MARIRLLQTSDVHLRHDRPERARALSLVFDIARNRSADAILIVGDLFDRDADLNSQHDLVRKLIEAVAPRPVLMIPGNHDAYAYGAHHEFGANAIVLGTTPRAHASACGLNFVGIPYQEGKTVAECLVGWEGDPRRTVLMAHANLLDFQASTFPGEGEAGDSMPIFAADGFERARYVALGHAHAGRRLVQREGERLLAHSGSPVATSPEELGQRSALLVDFECGVGVQSHDIVPLPTPFFEQIDVLCRPGAENEAVESLAREAAQLKRPWARVRARMHGVSIVAEEELREAAERELRRAFGGSKQSSPSTISLDPSAPDASVPILELDTVAFPSLAEIPLVGEFIERLESCARDEGIEDPAVLEAAWRIGLQAFRRSIP